MRLPAWIIFTIGGLVVAFGLYRIRLAFRSDEQEAAAREKGGLYGMSRRSHLLRGVIFIVLGAMLLATGFGFRPPWVR